MMLQEKVQKNTMQTWHNQKVRNNEKGIGKINCVINLLETKYRFLFNKSQHSELKKQ